MGGSVSVPSYAGHIAGISCVANPSDEPQATQRYGDPGAYPQTAPPEPEGLWSSDFLTIGTDHFFGGGSRPCLKHAG